MERLGSAKWLEIFERFRDLKKVEKHCSTVYANLEPYMKIMFTSSLIKKYLLFNYSA